MKELPRRPMPFIFICFGLLAVSAIFVLVMSKEEETVITPGGEQETNSVCIVPKISIAFCGNSMLYFNDCPRLMEQMISVGQAPVTVIQDSCLRGGASLTSLYNHGNGMQKKFATPPATIQLKNLLLSSNTTCLLTEEDGVQEPPKYGEIPDGISHDVGAISVEVLLQSTAWDYVVLNDYTQGPARIQTRKETQKALREKYVPLLLENNTTVVIVQTPAYKVPGLKESEDLGDFIYFSNLLADGVKSYVETLQAAGIPDSRVAPVGEAFRYLYHTNQQLWRRLYSWDHFHPSPHGTWLEACVIYCTIFRTVPPEYNADWWQYSRYMQPPDEEPLPRPTEEEAKELRRVACKVTEVPMEGEHRI